MKENSRVRAKKLPLHKKSWDDLTPRKKRMRKQALHALSLMRHDGENLSGAAKEAGLHPDTVRRHVGVAIVKKKGHYVAIDNDTISRSMVIKENGEDHFIMFDGSDIASRISGYHNAVKYYLQTGDDSKLREYEDEDIEDSEGVKHRLETDKEKVKESEEKKEDREFYQIYAE